MRKNIKRFKSREKKFDHFADYLITFATLFGLSSNTWINLINSKQEKYTFNLFIALVLDFYTSRQFQCKLHLITQLKHIKHT